MAERLCVRLHARGAGARDADRPDRCARSCCSPARRSAGLATAAFGLFADGLWSATAIWALAGIGFAGAYMPGLKALTDRLPPQRVLAQHHALHVELLDRRRAVVPRLAACRRCATAGARRSSSRRSARW